MIRNSNFQASGHLRACTARFVSDLVGNQWKPKCWFCHDAAHLYENQEDNTFRKNKSKR